MFSAEYYICNVTIFIFVYENIIYKKNVTLRLRIRGKQKSIQAASIII